MKRKIAPLMILAVMAMTGCSKKASSMHPSPKEGLAKSANGSGDFETNENSDNDTENNGSTKAPWSYPADAQSGVGHFNLAEHVKNSPEAKGLHKFVQEGFSGLGFGSKDKLRVETNLLVDSEANKPSNNATTAHYTVDIYIINKNVGGGKGSLVDYMSSARLDNPSKIEAHMRFLGDDKLANTNDVIDEHFMRELSIKVPVIPLPPTEIVMLIKVGGLFGLKTELGVKRDQQAQLLFVPEVDLLLTIAGGVRLLALIDANAEGQIKMLAMKPSVSANLGTNKTFVYGNIAEDSGGINAVDGKIDLVVDLGYKGVLPGGIDKIALQKSLEALGIGKIADGKEWRWNVFNPEPAVDNNIPVFTKPFILFATAPSSKVKCKSLSRAISPLIKSHIDELNGFIAKLDKEPKEITQKSSDLLNESAERMAAFCI